MPSLVCLGDVMLARGVSEVLERSDASELWGDTLETIRAADLRLADLECCISDRGKPFDPPRVFSFRAIPKAIDSLLAAAIDVVTLANNHSLDYGEEALLDTLHRLDAAGIAHVGAGRQHDDAEAPVIAQAADGTKVAFLGFTDNFPEYGSGSARPGTFFVRIDPQGLSKVKSSIARVLELKPDFIVVTCHWGPNMRRNPPEHFRDFARGVIDSGADLWFGHSAHIFQGIEFYQGKPIIYDGGDFIDDYMVDSIERNNLSLLWRANIGPQRMELTAYPVKLSFAQTNFAQGEERDWIIERLIQLCEQMGTAVEIKGDLLEITPQ